MKTLLLVLALVVGCALPASGQVSVKPTDGAGTERILGAAGKMYDSGLTAITTGGVTITSTQTAVQLLFCTNASGTDRTITVSNAAASAVYLTTVNVTANSAFLLHAGTIGLNMAGVKITASANSAISCQVQGVQ